jgi:hypothetical protein
VIWEWRHKTPIIEVRLFKNFFPLGGGVSVADAPKLAYSLLYPFVAGQAVTLAYLDMVPAIAASIMFLLSLHRSQERFQGGRRSGCGVTKLFGGC